MSLTVEQAREILRKSFARGPVVEVDIDHAVGSVLAEDLTTDRDFPPFDRMAMDGYAVRAADTVGASADSPVQLEVVGTAAAGEPFDGRLDVGQATKAMTGAPLPVGADAVVPIESTAGWSSETATIFATVEVGQHVAARGQDLSEGSVVLRAGTRLAARHLQAALSAGNCRVPVVAPPRVIVFATGDELVTADQTPGPAEIRESNRSCIRGVLAEWGIESVDGGLIPDRRDEMRRRFAAALAEFEVVIVSGGVSMGERDLVKPVLDECGVELVFESLHLKPGHPTTYGRHAGGHVFALPGNPVAVFVTLQMVFAAGLERRLGCRDREMVPQYGTLGFDAIRRGGRPQWLPVRLEAPPTAGLPVVRSTGHHGSGDFVSLARADALAYLPDDQRDFPAGTTVLIHRLRSEGA